MPTEAKIMDHASLPGHINNLTNDQELLLFKLWTKLLDYFAKPLEDSDTVGLSKKQIKKDKKEKVKKEKLEKKLLKKNNSEAQVEELGKSLEEMSTADSIGSEGSSMVNCLAEEFWSSLGKEDLDVFMLRFLRARKWNIDAAFHMLVGCLKWRKQIDIRKIVTEGESHIKLSLLQSGKTYFHGYDNENRLVGWINVGLHDKNGQTVDENEKFTIHQMEVGRLLFPAKSETVTMVFDMTGFNLQCMDYPSLKFLIGCMEAYYPESLGRALVLNAPWLFWGCWKVIKPWLDPVVAAKVQFIKKENLKEYIPDEYIPKKYDGSSNYQYKYDDKQPTAAPQPDSVELASLNIKYESFQEQFSTLTYQIEAFVERNDEKELNDLNALRNSRNKVKDEISSIFQKIDSITRNLNIYHRVGILDGETVNFKIASVK